MSEHTSSTFISTNMFQHTCMELLFVFCHSKNAWVHRLV